MQPPGSPVVTATKSVFKKQGNSAAVRSGDFFEYQNLIKFGQKNHDFFFLPNFDVAEEQIRKTKREDEQTDAENP